MMGLLDPQVDPLSLGLLGAGSAIMSGRRGLAQAPQAFAQGLLQGQQQQAQMRAQQQREQMLREQMEMQRQHFGLQQQEFGLKLEDAQSKRAAAERARLFQEEFVNAAAQRDPEIAQLARVDMKAAIERAYPKPEWREWFTAEGRKAQGYVAPGRAPQQVGGAESGVTFVDGVAVDKFSTQPGTTVVNPQKVANDLMIAGPNGPTPNQPLIEAKRGIARAGASNTSVRVENKMGESVGAQIGPMLRTSQEKTDGAVKMADSAERILSAIDKGGVIAGPTASLRLKGAQVASMLGIGGDNAVAQTRQVVRALSEASIEARKELAGQGQVTENEAKAVEKAMSGNIDDLTVSEIRDIARLNLRAAALRGQQHEDYLSRLPPEMQTARPFYEVRGTSRLRSIDPSRYAIPSQNAPPAAGSAIAPDGRSASGTIGGPSIEEIVRRNLGNAR